jgi:zinc D-Ala-D-Ala dipeptidase
MSRHLIVAFIFSAMLLSARAQTIEIPRQTKTPAPLPPRQSVSSSSRAQVTRASRTAVAPLQQQLPSLVDVQTVDPTIVIDLRYATEHNVTGHQLYPNGTKAMILPSVAQQLAGAQLYLKQFRYRLKIWDAYRPKSAQELLWKYASKDQYVANPEKGFGSMHSYGVSVDATLVDDWSQDVTMPTKFDQFTPQAMLRYAGHDPIVKQHLALLQKAMAHNNFYGLRVEWWHFTTADWKKYVPYWEDKQMSQTGETPSPKS